MEELSMLDEAFGSDEAPTAAARGRARTALLNRIHARETRRGWTIRRRALGMAVAAAAVAGVVGIVAVENLGPVDDPGYRWPAAQRAAAAGFLENAALAAGRRPWTAPRPDQFMYKESQSLHNSKEMEARAPNGPLVPGSTRLVREQVWKRIDAQVMGLMADGKLEVHRRGGPMSWGQIPYEDLVKLTTPEAVLAWDKAPKNFGVMLDALLGQYVLPPEVEAAFFRALARREGTGLNPDAVNIDGRPAVGLGYIEEDYLSVELLFDKETYQLIGERLVAIVDHTNVGDDGT
jgi:hypothetical protein